MGQNTIISGVQVAQEPWTLYWESLVQQPTGTMSGWQGPVISPYYAPALWPPNTSIDRRVLRGDINGNALPQAQEPWCMGLGITLIGVQCQLICANPQAQLSLVLGQAGGAGPDVFFHMAGVGNVEKTMWLPPDARILFDTDQNHPNAHFDFYTACSDPYQILCSVFYLAPPVPPGTVASP